MATTDHFEPAVDRATASDALLRGRRGLVALVPPAIAVAVCIPAIGGLTALRWAMVAWLVAAAWIHVTGRGGTAAVEITVYITTSVCWMVAASTPFTVSAFDQIAVALCLVEIAAIWQDRIARSRRDQGASRAAPRIGAALMVATLALLALGIPRQARFELSRAQLEALAHTEESDARQGVHDVGLYRVEVDTIGSRLGGVKSEGGLNMHEIEPFVILRVDRCPGAAGCYLVWGSVLTDGVDLGTEWQAKDNLSIEDLPGIPEWGF